MVFLGHVPMGNRHDLVVETRLTRATGTAECDGSPEMIGEKRRQKRGRLTLGGNRNYDSHEQVASLRALEVAPHLAQNTERQGASALDQRTTRAY